TFPRHWSLSLAPLCYVSQQLGSLLSSPLPSSLHWCPSLWPSISSRNTSGLLP
ncbi:hypothetical protein M9458_009658, partial [Cirrhinus mrigala]